jgi:ATP-binding cassette subfamily F protein 2
MGRKDNKKKSNNSSSSTKVDEATTALKSLGFEGEVDRAKISVRTATGQLTSQFLSRDLKIESFSISLHGHELVADTKLELNWGRRYGLIGLNGSGT